MNYLQWFVKSTLGLDRTPTVLQIELRTDVPEAMVLLDNGTARALTNDEARDIVDRTYLVMDMQKRYMDALDEIEARERT